MVTETISDVKSAILLSPANLLIMKSNLILRPRRGFSSADIDVKSVGEEFHILQMNLVEIAHSVPAKTARTKNLQNLKKKLSKR